MSATWGRMWRAWIRLTTDRMTVMVAMTISVYLAYTSPPERDVPPVGGGVRTLDAALVAPAAAVDCVPTGIRR